jgi:hypothetical protein
VLETYAWERLRHFRQELYDNLGVRQDSLFELSDAMLTTPHRSTLVRLSLSTAFRRRWPSTCDALADGTVDEVASRQLFARVCGAQARSMSVRSGSSTGRIGHGQPRAPARIGRGSIGH